MIVEYHRPESLDSALALLTRSNPLTVPLGGGTVLSRHSSQALAVVDLQMLSLNNITRQGNYLFIGATATLQDLVDSPEVPETLAAVARREASYNLRQAATVAGTIVSGGGTSPLLTALLALDADLMWMPGQRQIPLGEWLPLRRERQSGLIVELRLPLQAGLRYEQVGRTPADQPMISAAAAVWPSGRTRVAIGGDIPTPVVTMDGPESGGAEETIINAYSHYRNQKILIEYVHETAKTLIRRLLDR